MHSQLHDQMYRTLAADRVRGASRAAIATGRQHPPPVRGRVARIARRIESARKAVA